MTSIHAATTNRQRWLALLVLCLGVLMIVLDTTIVNVALPSIKNDLKFSETSLVWVVNAYILTFGGFLLLQARVAQPLMPLGLFRSRNVSVANVVAVLWAAAMFAWFFISALYMQQVLNYTPMQVGLAFLPANLIMAACSLGWSAKLVMVWGNKLPLACGLLLAAIGLAWFGRAPVAGQFVEDVLPGMVLLGLGAGIAFNPMLLVAMGDVEPDKSGLASGVVNTAFMMGGALGLAVLASLAAATTAAQTAAGMNAAEVLNAGYQVAFLVGAAFAASAAGISYLMLKNAIE